MNKRLAYGLAALLLLTGCAAGGDAAQTASSTAAAAPSSAAEPVPMSIEESATYYLTHVCPMNDTVDEFDEVYLPAYAKAEDGGQPALEPLTTAAAKLRDAQRDLADAFSAEGVRWPSELQEDIKPFLEDAYDNAAQAAVLASAKTPDQFFALMADIEQRAAQSPGPALGQKFRAELNLPADPYESCADYIGS
jgi:hypothetical protein